MRAKFRHMKKYKPRRRRNSKVLQKQQLIDFEHLLNMDLSSFLVLAEEGNPKQIESARVKVRTDVMKYGSDMEAIGRDLGEGFPEMVKEYLRSMQKIIQSPSEAVDPGLLNTHRTQAQRIRKAAA